MSKFIIYFLVPVAAAFCSMELQTAGHAPVHKHLAGTGTSAVPDHLTYEVLRNNKVIGTVRSARLQKGSLTEYATESTVHVSILVDLTIYTRVIGIYSHGQLLSGSVIRKVNNSTRVNAKISWQQDRYWIEEDGKKQEFHGKIPYASSCLMHVEPVGLTQIFSEAHKQLIPIRPIKPHQYELQLPDGHKNYYTYADGICVEAEVNTSLSKAFFRLKK